MSLEFLFDMEAFYMALADKTRLRLLNLMRQGEVCVGYFTEVLGESQPKISRHLAYLRGAGVVEARRDGKWMHYRIVRPDNALAAGVLDATLAWLESEDDMLLEFDLLQRLCSLPAAEIPQPTLRRAPRPSWVPTEQPELPELETFLL